jgi:hypothetical protein
MNRYVVLTACLLGRLMLAGPAVAQKWSVDPKISLAWWQVSPHLGHLWATSCPGDSSWRPGEGRSSGWNISKNLKMPGSGDAGVDDTVHVPLYPRHVVYPVCGDAVRGEISVPDTVHWRQVSGTIAIKGATLVTGQNMRDAMTRQILQTEQFPEVLFKIDSLTNMRKVADTLVGTAVGTLVVRANPYPHTAQVKAFRDGGGMRVLGKIRMKARQLQAMTPKLEHMGLGVNTNIWHDFFVGVDVVLKPSTGASSSSSQQGN